MFAWGGAWISSCVTITALEGLFVRASSSYGWEVKGAKSESEWVDRYVRRF